MERYTANLVDLPIPVTGALVMSENGGAPGEVIQRPQGRVGIGARRYTRGISCRPRSVITVCLPAPAAFFTSIAGVEGDGGPGGKRRIAFSVAIGGMVAFATKELEEGTEGTPVNVALKGARALTLEATFAAGSDNDVRAAWAEARVRLEDGSELWLDDMPLLGAPPRAPRHGGTLPFSFIYGGESSDAILPRWNKDEQAENLEAGRRRRTVTWTDPQTGLEVRWVSVEYAGFPVVEWTVHLRNGGAATSPVLSDIQGYDAVLECGQGTRVVLNGNKGDWCVAEGYEPYSHELRPGQSRWFAPWGGRGTNGPHGWPYFNVAMAEGGIILAVGWPGQWLCSFTRQPDSSLRVIAGQELTRLRLRPGEEVRTPLIALLSWTGGDAEDAQNLWRRWMWAHNVPRRAGDPLEPYYAFCSGGFFPGLKVSEHSERQFIETLARENIPLDYWWMDAGWYPCESWWTGVGTWEPDRERFPHGIKAVSDLAHARGARLVLWFEPERVSAGSWIALNHPEWLLRAPGGRGAEHLALLNLGNTDAREWVTRHAAAALAAHGVEIYRQDFNMDPLSHWRLNDAPDRQGMTENLHVQGYLAYWDALLRLQPGLVIDSCASGGRRNDLESMRRAVPLTRSDYIAFDGNPAYAAGNQGQTYGLASWIPYFGNGVYPSADIPSYYVRSHLSPCFDIAVDVRKPGIDWDAYRLMAAQWRAVAGCMLGDYHPLTPYSLSPEAWMAWQFNGPVQGDGMVQAFRREESTEGEMTLRLRGLDPAALYEVADLDGRFTARLSGKAIMAEGVRVRIGERPGSALIVYRRA